MNPRSSFWIHFSKQSLKMLGWWLLNEAASSWLFLQPCRATETEFWNLLLICQASHRENLAVGNAQLHVFSHLIYSGWVGNSHTWFWPGTLAQWWSSGRQEAWEGPLGHSSLRCQPSSLCPTEIVKLSLTRECSSKKLDSCLGILLTEHFVFKFLTSVSHSTTGWVVSLATCYVYVRDSEVSLHERELGKSQMPVGIAACGLANLVRFRIL